MTDLATLKARILANPEARAEYEAQAPEFELAHELIAARIRAGLTQAELAAALKDAVKELSPPIRLTILLKYFEELSYDEIAQVLNCSPGTVASRLNRGHKALALRLAHLRQ